jgi:hypothetical protein
LVPFGSVLLSRISNVPDRSTQPLTTSGGGEPGGAAVSDEQNTGNEYFIKLTALDDVLPGTTCRVEMLLCV